MSSIVRKIIRAPELYCALLMLVGVFCSQACQPKIENIVLSQNGIQREISLPLVEKLGDGAVFDVSFDIVQGIEIPFDLKVVPDDCADFVIINGQKEFLGLVEGHCNYSNGFVLPDSIPLFIVSFKFIPQLGAVLCNHRKAAFQGTPVAYAPPKSPCRD